MKILVTGAAGFIGHALAKRLLSEGHEVMGIDNLNDYYDPKLKIDRLSDLGIDSSRVDTGASIASDRWPQYHFQRLDLTDADGLDHLFATGHFTHVMNLAGQAGVRYSIENPESYVQSNVVGFLNILQGCRHHGVSHLVYASSSSIYGMDPHVPFRESDDTDHPVSLYAATKKSNELMAHAYSKLFGLQTTGLRFFTVYGPWGRPDMAPFKFIDAMMHDRTFQVYNHGDMLRDFTYIDDIVDGIVLALKADIVTDVPFKVYNIGCSHPVRLLDFIQTMEQVTGRNAKIQMLGMQPGDVTRTYADVSLIHDELGYTPHTSVREGLKHLYDWYKKYVG